MTEKKIQKTNWKITENRFVAFLDILGFKDLISKNSHSEIYDQLNKISKTKKFLESAAHEEKKPTIYIDAEIYIVSFSDSIVVFSKNDSIENFFYFLNAVRWLFARTIVAGIPLKGGIALGEVSLNKTEQIYFGQAIIDAYFMEEDVNHIGVVANYSIDNYLKTNEKKIDQAKLNEYLFEEKTPLKCGNLRHFNLNWYKKTSLIKDALTEEEKYNRILELINNFKLTSSGSPRKYVDNSLDFIEKSKAKISLK